MSLHAIRRALSASVLTARRPWLANYDPFYTATNGLRENLDDRFCHHPGAPGSRVAKRFSARCLSRWVGWADVAARKRKQDKRLRRSGRAWEQGVRIHRPRVGLPTCVAQSDVEYLPI